MTIRPQTSAMRVFLPALLPLVLAAAGCAGPAAQTPAGGASYRVVWTVRRAADNASLAGVVSPPVRVGGGELRVRTDSQRAEENRPAFPEFLARLSPTTQRGVIELVTRASVLEADRNKKGKLKVHKRFIGGLLPIRPGETLGVSGPADPLTVQVRLEPGR